MNQHHVSFQHLKQKLSKGKICVKNVIPQANGAYLGYYLVAKYVIQPETWSFNE